MRMRSLTVSIIRICARSKRAMMSEGIPIPIRIRIRVSVSVSPVLLSIVRQWSMKRSIPSQFPLSESDFPPQRQNIQIVLIPTPTATINGLHRLFLFVKAIIVFVV